MKIITVNGKQVNAADFAASVLGSCFSNWSWWVKVHYVKPFDWDSPPEDLAVPFLRLTYENPGLSNSLPPGTNRGLQHPTYTSFLSLAILVEAYEQLVKSNPKLNWKNLDASSSDAIMQQAVFGEIVFC